MHQYTSEVSNVIWFGIVYVTKISLFIRCKRVHQNAYSVPMDIQETVGFAYDQPVQRLNVIIQACAIHWQLVCKRHLECHVPAHRCTAGTELDRLDVLRLAMHQTLAHQIHV